MPRRRDAGFRDAVEDAERRDRDHRPEELRTDEPATSAGRIPANVSVTARATVTAGFAKDVEDVNQYADVM